MFTTGFFSDVISVECFMYLQKNSHEHKKRLTVTLAFPRNRLARLVLCKTNNFRRTVFKNQVSHVIAN